MAAGTLIISSRKSTFKTEAGLMRGSAELSELQWAAMSTEPQAEIRQFNLINF